LIDSLLTWTLPPDSLLGRAQDCNWLLVSWTSTPDLYLCRRSRS
jgi:hypothetical protein